MAIYQRKIITALMQTQVDFYKKIGRVDTPVFDDTIFKKIKNYAKHRAKYEQALIECVQLSYVAAVGNRNSTSFLVTETGVRALHRWKEIVITIVTSIISAVVTTIHVTYIPALITYLEELLSKQ